MGGWVWVEVWLVHNGMDFVDVVFLEPLDFTVQDFSDWL